MNTAQIPQTVPDKLSRCKVIGLPFGTGRVHDDENIQKDNSLAYQVDQALWKNEVLRAMDYYEVDVQVNDRIVLLSGHIVSSTSNDRVEKAISAIPGILGVQNNLVLDDQLTTEVASALGNLEHLYNCKFFTGVNYGVVTLHGNVNDENIKSQAERCVADNPNVRAVVNRVRIQGMVSKLQDTPVYQPVIGQEILFQNGVSGFVQQVIINPDNRCVTAMILVGCFTDQLQEFQSMTNNETRPLEHKILVSVDLIRYLTKFSGFLTISSHDRNRFVDFDSTAFRAPEVGWVPPYPYCPQDVLFNFTEGLLIQPADRVPLHSVLAIKLNQILDEQVMTNDSLGG